MCSLPIGSSLQDGKYIIRDFCSREKDSNKVNVGSNYAEQVDVFKLKFLSDAKSNARGKIESEIKVFDVFEENNTAYYVFLGNEDIVIEEQKEEEIEVTAEETHFVSSEPINSEETVVVRTTSINNNEHQYVDLGLSVKWAKFNIGAKSEYEVGDLLPFATSQISNITTTICANKQYDHCYKAWGGDWRLPTKHEQDELRLQCQWEFLKDKKCYKVTGPSGNHILLPATEMVLGGTVGSYWSGELHMSNNLTAYYLKFHSGLGNVTWMNDSINKEFAIRGVIQ